MNESCIRDVTSRSDCIRDVSSRMESVRQHGDCHEVLSYTDARQEVQDIPEATFREIPLHSLNHLSVLPASQASLDE